MDLNAPLTEYSLELRTMILTLVKTDSDRGILAQWLDSRNIMAHSHNLNIESNLNYLTFDGVKFRPQVLIWGWFYPELASTFKELLALKLNQLSGWSELNPWHFMLRKASLKRLPITLRSTSETYGLEIQQEKDRDYYRRKLVRKKSKESGNGSSHVSEEDFEFLD